MHSSAADLHRFRILIIFDLQISSAVKLSLIIMSTSKEVEQTNLIGRCPHSFEAGLASVCLAALHFNRNLNNRFQRFPAAMRLYSRIIMSKSKQFSALLGFRHPSPRTFTSNPFRNSTLAEMVLNEVSIADKHYGHAAFSKVNASCEPNTQRSL